MSKDFKTDLPDVDLTEVLKEINAKLKIKYYTATATLTLQQLEFMKSKGVKTNAIGCLLGAFAFYSKMKEEEILKFFKEAEENDSTFSIAFESVDEKTGINLSTPEAAPNFDKLVQAAK